ncbi:MAG: PEP-CTERM sorting domain-containing protein [Puniceicoccaceae bacterium]
MNQSIKTTLTVTGLTLATLTLQGGIVYQQTFGGLTEGDLSGQAGFNDFGNPDDINVVNGFSLGAPTNYNSIGNITTAPGIVRGPFENPVDDGFLSAAYYNFNALGINWDTDGEHWISYSFSQAFQATGVQVLDLGLMDNGFATQMKIGLRNTTFGVQAGATGTTTSALGSGQVNFALIQILTSSSGSDTINFSIYDTTESLPTSGWTPEASATGNISGTSTSFYIAMANFDFAAASSQFDQLVVGESYIDVTGVAVPEPSTYAALAGFLTVGLLILRRRYRG